MEVEKTKICYLADAGKYDIDIIVSKIEKMSMSEREKMEKLYKKLI